MNLSIRYFRLSVFICLILLVNAGQPAKADTYNLNSADQPFTGSAPYASVVISTPSAGSVRFDVTVLTSPTDTLGEFAFNTDLSGVKASNFTTMPSGWSVSANSAMDGFGKFGFDVGNTSASTRHHQVTIILTGLAATTLSHFEIGNSKGNLFAVHLFQPSLTGYVAGGDKVLIQTLSVPEPSTLAIAGSGTLGFIGFGLHRRKKSSQPARKR
jgi:hypothetical protein